MAIKFEVSNVYLTPEGFLLIVTEVTDQNVTFRYLGARAEVLRERGESDKETVAKSIAQKTAEQQRWKLRGISKVSWVS